MALADIPYRNREVLARDRVMGDRKLTRYGLIQVSIDFERPGLDSAYVQQPSGRTDMSCLAGAIDAGLEMHELGLRRTGVRPPAHTLKGIFAL